MGRKVLQELRFGTITMEFKSYIISHRPERIQPIIRNLAPVPVEHFDGSGFKSFSSLVNSCIANCPTETVIIMSDKVLPNEGHVKKTLDLIENGFAFVALYRFAFFGFKKELIRKIGFMDERYVGGGYEDDDFYIRLREANLSMYATEEVPYEKMRSTWDQVDVNQHFVSKWGNVKLNNCIKRDLKEESYSYNLGSPVPTSFKPWHESVIKPTKVKKWSNYPIIK